MSVLVPCDSCRRHVRADEGACPFCRAAIAPDAASRAVPPANRRLDRVAFFTFATLAAAACSAGGAGSLEDAGSDGRVNDDGGMQALYGASRPDSGPKDDGGMQAAYGISPFDGGVQPPYGIAPFDAAPPDDGGKDAGKD